MEHNNIKIKYSFVTIKKTCYKTFPDNEFKKIGSQETARENRYTLRE